MSQEVMKDMASAEPAMKRRLSSQDYPYFNDLIWAGSKFVAIAETTLTDGTKVSKEVCTEGVFFVYYI